MHFGSILVAFWQHFGNILGALLAPFGFRRSAVGVPLVPFGIPLAALWHPCGTLFAPCCSLVVSFGLVSLPSSILEAFCVDFKRIFPYLARVWHYLAVSGVCWQCLAVSGGIPIFF